MPHELRGVITRRAKAGYMVLLENGKRVRIRTNERLKSGKPVWVCFNYVRMKPESVRKRI